MKFRRSATVTSRSPSSGSIRASRRCAINPSEPKMCGCRPSRGVRRLLCDFASFTTDHVLFSAADNFLGTAIVLSRNLWTSVPSRYVVTARRVVTSAQAPPGVLLPQCGECHATPGDVRSWVATRASHIFPRGNRVGGGVAPNPPTPVRCSGCNGRKWSKRRTWSKPAEVGRTRQTLRLRSEPPTATGGSGRNRRKYAGPPNPPTPVRTSGCNGRKWSKPEEVRRPRQTLRLQPEEVVETGGSRSAPPNPPTPVKRTGCNGRE